jgi:hypothetical protein
MNLNNDSISHEKKAKIHFQRILARGFKRGTPFFPFSNLRHTDGLLSRQTAFWCNMLQISRHFGEPNRSPEMASLVMGY